MQPWLRLAVALAKYCNLFQLTHMPRGNQSIAEQWRPKGRQDIIKLCRVYNIYNVWVLRNGLHRFWLHRHDRYQALTWMIKVGAETNLGGGDMSAFVSLLAAIARALSLTSDGSTVLRKGTRRFWPHGRDRCRSLTLTCRTSPCWLSCECWNNVLSSLGCHRLSVVAMWHVR